MEKTKEQRWKEYLKAKDEARKAREIWEDWEEEARKARDIWEALDNALEVWDEAWVAWREAED